MSRVRAAVVTAALAAYAGRAGADEPSPFDSTVRAAVPMRHLTASEYNLTIGTLDAVPRVNGSELLDLAPGVILTNDGNEGHAAHVYMRGFYGEDGSDTALSVEGVPLNDVSNPEHHGYADVYLVIPELVDRLDVTEGTPDPRQGDFAIAGSIDYRLALHERGATLKASYGRYGSTRIVALWGPRGAGDDTFAGADYAHSDGYGTARRFDRASLLAQVARELRGGLKLRVLVGMTTSQWDSPGVVREDDYEAGRIGFYGAYATARGQGGASSHGILSVALDRRAARAHDHVDVWARLRDYTLREDFTGYLDHPVEGDLTRFLYHGATAGADGSIRRTWVIGGHPQDLEIGLFGRYDRFTLSATQMDARTGLPIAPPDEEDVGGTIGVADVALYADVALRPTSRLTVRGGVRVDVLDYVVDAASHLDAWSTHVGPKATVELALGRGLVLLASYGSGFRSADALSIAGGNAPVAAVTGEDLGLRWGYFGPRARLTAALSAFHSAVGRDELFDPTVNRTVEIGATHRLGAALWVRTQPLPWLDLNGSFVYTYALADEDALDGRLRAGQPLPYLPPIVMRLDAAFEKQVGRWRRLPVVVRAGVGATLRGPMPLLTLPATTPIFIVDLLGGVRVGFVEVQLGIRNLFDTRWRESVYENPSSFTPGATPSQVPVENFTAGTPFNVYATVVVHL